MESEQEYFNGLPIARLMFRLHSGEGRREEGVSRGNVTKL